MLVGARIRHKVGPWGDGEALANAKLCSPWAKSRLVKITAIEGIWPTICRQTFFSAVKSQYGDITPNLALICSQHESPCLSHSFLTQFHPQMSLPLLFILRTSPSLCLTMCISSQHRCTVDHQTKLCIFQLCRTLNSSHHLTVHLTMNLLNMHLPTLYTHTMNITAKWVD